jgi:predicted  nucleic acid-binding Zn-ribbon protein
LLIALQALEKQKRKNEEDRLALVQMTKEYKNMTDACDELERKRLKIEHDLQTKEAHVACLEGQLSHSKQSFDAEVVKVNHICWHFLLFYFGFVCKHQNIS